jgi:hypothetical protein
MIKISVFLVVCLSFLSFALPILAEEILIQVPPFEPQYIELASTHTGFSADVEDTTPISVMVLALVNLSETEAYIERLQIHSEGDQWLVKGNSFRGQGQHRHKRNRR